MAFPAILPIPPHTIPNRHNKPLHSLRHAGAPTSARTLCTDTRYHRRTGRCTGQHSRPIIIRYIRVQGCAPVMDPCQTVQQIADHASRVGSAPTVYGSPASADTLSAVHTRRDSPAAGARRAARNHWRLPPYLFSGFRPIANRGQQ